MKTDIKLTLAQTNENILRNPCMLSTTNFIRKRITWI
jgi:hypothetical protein